MSLGRRSLKMKTLFLKDILRKICVSSATDRRSMSDTADVRAMAIPVGSLLSILKQVAMRTVIAIKAVMRNPSIPVFSSG